jgi:aspartate oxidase
LQRRESRGLHAIADYPKKLKVARDSRVRRLANLGVLLSIPPR